MFPLDYIADIGAPMTQSQIICEIIIIFEVIQPL